VLSSIHIYNTCEDHWENTEVISSSVILLSSVRGIVEEIPLYLPQVRKQVWEDGCHEALVQRLF